MGEAGLAQSRKALAVITENAPPRRGVSCFGYLKKEHIHIEKQTIEKPETGI